MYNSDCNCHERANTANTRQRHCNVAENAFEMLDEGTAATIGCGDSADSVWGLRGYPLASVYSPLQNFTEIYDCENALTKGTIFAELDLPFVCGGMSGGASRG